MIKEVLRGVMERVVNLTTMNKERLKMKIDELYPEHIKSLRLAGLIKGGALMFEKIIKGMDDPARIEKKREREKRFKERRNVYFCIGFSKKWTIPLFKVFKELKIKHKLKWLRVRVSYTTFANVNLLLNGDVVHKMQQGWKCRKTGSELCNCGINNKNKCL